MCANRGFKVKVGAHATVFAPCVFYFAAGDFIWVRLSFHKANSPVTDILILYRSAWDVLELPI